MLMFTNRVSTPYAPPAQAKAGWTDLETIVRRQLPNFGYQLFFAEKDAAKLVQRNVSCLSKLRKEYRDEASLNTTTPA